MYKKFFYSMVMSFVVIICGQQLLAQRRIESNCWQSYVSTVNHSTGSLEKVLRVTDKAWDDYMQCATGFSR